jgi:hypothetical protein
MDVVSQFRKRMLLVVVGCLGLFALVCFVIALAGSVSGTAGRILASAVLIALACLFAFAGATVRKRVPALALSTVAANAVSALCLQALIWSDGRHGALAQVTLGLGSLAIYGSLVSLVVWRSRSTDLPEVRVAQAIGCAGLGVLTVVFVYFGAVVQVPSRDALAIAGAGTIVGVFGVLAASLLRVAGNGSHDPGSRLA